MIDLKDIQLPGTRALSKPGRTFPGCLYHKHQMISTNLLQSRPLTSVHQATQRGEQPNTRGLLVTKKTFEAVLAGELSTLGRNGRFPGKNSDHGVIRDGPTWITQTKIHCRW
jgi:hypothetical protein